MDRRTFVMTGAWLSAAGGALPWIAHAAGASNTIAVVDTSLAPGRALADYAARRGMPAFEVGDDMGTLWYVTLAPRLATAPGLLLGIARASDYFVLGQLALRAGRMTEHRCKQGTGLGAPLAFLLGPAAGH